MSRNSSAEELRSRPGGYAIIIADPQRRGLERGNASDRMVFRANAVLFQGRARPWRRYERLPAWRRPITQRLSELAAPHQGDRPPVG